MTLFLMAFERDIDFHEPYPLSVYLDLDSGLVIWVYDCDNDAYSEVGISEEENKSNRKLVNDNPERYLEIPGLSHGDHHQILQDFLDSQWTDDQELWQKVIQQFQKTDEVAALSFLAMGAVGDWKFVIVLAEI